MKTQKDKSSELLEQHYAQYDQDGNIIGFYLDTIHSNIPPNTIKITQNEWIDCISNQGKWIVIKGKLQLAPQRDPALIIREAKDARAVFLNSQWKKILAEPVTFQSSNMVTSKYDSSENAINLIQIALDQGELYHQNLWIDIDFKIISPFTAVDLRGLLYAINMKISRDPSYIVLLDKLRAVEDSITLEQIASITF